MRDEMYLGVQVIAHHCFHFLTQELKADCCSDGVNLEIKWHQAEHEGGDGWIVGQLLVVGYFVG